MRGWICAETIEPVTLHGIIGRVVRPLIVVGGILPAVVLVIRLLTGTLGADPAEDLEHSTGLTALILLLSSLAMTPLKRLTGLTALVRLRKPLGLWAFAYAVMHLSCYLVFDQSLLWGEIGRDIVKRPYITVAGRDDPETGRAALAAAASPGLRRCRPGGAALPVAGQARHHRADDRRNGPDRAAGAPDRAATCRPNEKWQHRAGAMMRSGLLTRGRPAPCHD
jgi:hypothetical protein